MRSCWILCLLAVTAPRAVQVARPQDDPIDELIERLPQVECDRTFQRGKGWQLTPEAQAMRQLIDEVVLSDAQWQRALLRTGAIRWRSRWPVDEPFAISTRVPRWLELGKITLRPCWSGWRESSVGLLKPAGCVMAWDDATRPALNRVLGPVPTEPTVITFEVEVLRGSGWSEDRNCFETLWSGTIDLPLEPVDHFDRVIPPASGEALERAVAHSLRISWYRSAADCPAIASLWLDPDIARDPILADIGLSLEIEVLDHGVVVETQHLIATDIEGPHELGAPPRWCAHFLKLCSLKSLPSALAEVGADRSRWSLRVRGTSRDALRLWHASARWQGELEIPLEELMQNYAQHDAELRAGGWR